MREERRVFVGYDPREHIASAVCCSSIRRYSGVPVRELRLTDSDVRTVYSRPYRRENGQYIDGVNGAPFSTQFSFSRFLIPYLMAYQGWAVFCDCDFLFRNSIDDLFDVADPAMAVQVVKHRHKPDAETKMDGVAQTRYGRKNWSSLILWNCGHPANRKITPGEVSRQPGLWLHQFGWLDDEEIGELPVTWNFLVGHNDPKECPNPKAVHFTEGGPWWTAFRDVPFSADWRCEMENFQHWSES